MTCLSFLEFLGVRITIGALRLLMPGSVVYLVFCATKPQYFNPLLALYATSEFLFYLLIYLPRRASLQAPPKYFPQALTQEQRRLTLARFIESIENDVTDSPYPACWFLAKHSRPKRDDVLDGLSWAFFNTSRGQSEHEDELRESIETIEKALGVKFEDGRSKGGTARCMRVHLDPVDMLHRPLLWYFIICLVDMYTSIILLILGFKHFTPREAQWRKTFPPRPLLQFLSQPAPDGAVFPYWYRPHKSSTKLPLLFLHGIGLGWFMYIPFLRTIMNGDPDVGILLPEFMSIRMHMTPQSIPPVPLLLAGLELVLESLSRQSGPNEIPDSQQPSHSIRPEHTKTGSRRPWDRVVLMGDSYGTFIAGCILRKMVDATPDGQITHNLASKIAHVVFVDPLPILISNAVVANNFLYRSPSTVCPHRLGSNGFGDENRSNKNLLSHKTAFYSSPAAWQIWYFASRDADIARTLFRTFFWTEGVVWREDIAAFMTGCLVGDLGDLTTHRHSSKQIRRNMAVVLGGLDQLVPAQSVRRYLTQEQKPTAHWLGRVRIDQGQVEIRPPSDEGSHAVGGDLEVFYNPGLDHSAIYRRSKSMAPLVEVVQRYIRGG